MTVDPDDIADQVLLLDGPHTPEAMAAAADVIAELVRRLNHATLAHLVERTLSYPSQADRLVAALGTATSRLPQLCQQLNHRMRTFAADRNVGVDDLGPAFDPSHVALTAAECLADAEMFGERTADAFSRARRSTLRLTYQGGAE